MFKKQKDREIILENKKMRDENKRLKEKIKHLKEEIKKLQGNEPIEKPKSTTVRIPSEAEEVIKKIYSILKDFRNGAEKDAFQKQFKLGGSIENLTKGEIITIALKRLSEEMIISKKKMDSLFIGDSYLEDYLKSLSLDLCKIDEYKDSYSFSFTDIEDIQVHKVFLRKLRSNNEFIGNLIFPYENTDNKTLKLIRLKFDRYKYCGIDTLMSLFKACENPKAEINKKCVSTVLKDQIMHKAKQVELTPQELEEILKETITIYSLLYNHQKAMTYKNNISNDNGGINSKPIESETNNVYTNEDISDKEEKDSQEEAEM